MTPGKIYEKLKWERKGLENSWILFENASCNSKRNIRQNLKIIWNGRRSELKAKKFYRKGCAKRPKSQVLTVHRYFIEDIPLIGSFVVFKVKLYFFYFPLSTHYHIFFRPCSHMTFARLKPLNIHEIVNLSTSWWVYTLIALSR